MSAGSYAKEFKYGSSRTEPIALIFSLSLEISNSSIVFSEINISTFVFIKNNQFKSTLEIAAILLNDPQDLIHKAMGWMLREIGKRDSRVEENFLKEYYRKMPRTMLRYAIERFDEKKKKYYMGK